MHRALRLAKFAQPYKSWIILATLLGVATVASGVGLMSTSAYLISMAARHPSIAALDVAIVGVRFFGLARGITRYLERLVTHHVTFRLLTRLRVWTYQHLEPLAPARLFHSTHSQNSGYHSGDLLTRLVSDIDTLKDFFARVLAPPLVALLVGLSMWFWLGAFDPQIALVFSGLYLLSATILPLISTLLSQSASQQVTRARASLNTNLIESLQGLADTLIFGQAANQAHQTNLISQSALSAQQRITHLNGLQEALSTFMMNATAWVVLLMAIPLIRNGQFNGIFLALLVLAILASFEAALPLSAAFQQLGSSLTSARRLFELLDAQPAVLDPAPGTSPSSLVKEDQYTITINHLSFRYAPDKSNVITDLNLELPAHQCTALLGPSGSGKTTLAHLLLRFWDYSDGQILLNGRDLCSYPQNHIRQLIAVVAQDTHLFNTSIRQNLLLANPDASEDEMIKAAQQAHIHDFILTLPRAYDTVIGEQGLNLSGGQRQRLAIARAMLKNAPILILDEPTANLDPATADAVMSTLQTLMAGRTTLLISHREGDISVADHIIHF